MRKFLGFSFLLAQLMMIAVARFSPLRYFCWAPFDAISRYSIRAFINGKELTSGEIAARYRMPAVGRDNRAIENLKDKFRQYEETYGRTHPAHLVMRYRTNGIKKEEWHWP